MKFSWKILLCTMLIMAAACGASGYFFVNYVFQTSMERETRQALDESSILRFAFETAALNIPSKYDVLPDGTVEQIGVYLENSGQHGNRLLRISDENDKVLYVSEGFTGDTSLWEERGENTRVYRVVQSGDSYYIQTQTRINVSDRLLTLETMKNVTAVYTERTEGFRMYRQVTVIVLLCSGAVMTLIACWLTRPIRLLTQATGKMAEGEYSYRAEQISNDEMGQLTADFNHMAEALEQNIQNLENEVRAREDFIAAFSHELKTPLTAIIGYADMLRSRKLDEEKHFLCANYIYTEGKRLETMALRLLDIIVTRRKEIDRKTTNVSGIFSYLQEIYDETKNPEDSRVKVDICWEKGELYAEENLLKTVFALLHRTGRGCWLFGLCWDLSSRGGIAANGYRLRGGRLLLGGSGFFASGHFVSRFGRLGLVGGRLIRLGWAASAGLCRRLLFVGLGRCLLRFFSLRGTATAGLFLFSRNLLLRLFLLGLFSRFLGLAGSGSLRGGRFGLFHNGGRYLRGGGLGLFHRITGSRPALRHQLFDFVKGHDHITGLGYRYPSLFLRGCPSGQIRGRGIGAGNICGRSLGSNRLAFDGGNIFLFLHLLTSNLSVILHKNELENFVLIF